MTTPMPITLSASETRAITSQHTGRDYRITISLPLGYSIAPDDSLPFDNSAGKWSVVYAVDGNYLAGVVTDTVRLMAWGKRTTDAIVVTIGYPDNGDPAQSFRTWGSHRTADLTPIPTETEDNEVNGEAGHFLKFIKEELIPMIETEFSADPEKRILAGHSYGGLFGAFVMLTEPDLFRSIIMGSPSLWYGDGHMFRQEEEFFKNHKKLPVAVYMFVGELEETVKYPMLTDALRFATVLQERNYKGFSLVKQIFVDQNHTEVPFSGLQWGLRHALKA